MRINRKIILTIASLAVFTVFFGGNIAMGLFKDTPSHLDSYKQTRGCGACHRGRGAPGTPLLNRSIDAFCFQCHGREDRRWSKTDMESEFNKFSVHPVLDTTRYHQLGEQLPETNTSEPRHVSCFDCHVVHMSEPDTPWKGARGYEPAGLRGLKGPGLQAGLPLNRANYEFELCYLCHSESANLPNDSKNIAYELNPLNESFHPVEAEGRNKDMPSLLRQFNVNSRISCSDCHGNSDSIGPKGPHGSDYEPLLLAEYRTEDGMYEPKAYELCLMCHDRNSLLWDESFQAPGGHNLHIVSAKTSCYTCHSSHGSAENPNLISFNSDVVKPVPNTLGEPEYIIGLKGRPKCYLSCHGVVHNNTGVGVKSWDSLLR